ncbi:MAG: DUF1178 family protein [Roseovarius sp.]|nr:DUF1178 family protein [Roseovarius sp.]
MIRFSLKCDQGHRFDSWFQSAEGFDRLCDARMLSCSVCGSQDVAKALMTPQVQGTRDAQALTTPPSAAEQAIAEIRRKVEANADYVGPRFAQEARDMHDGTTPERAIYGEARADEARRLVEDGIPILPLPFSNRRKTN